MHRTPLFMALAGLAASVVVSPAATVSTLSGGSPVAPAGAPRSTFANEFGGPGFGKDPFFPKTTRFVPKPVKPNEGIVDPPQPDFPARLELKGVSFVAGRKLAIINYQTVAEQEEFSIRIDGKQVKGQCVEIKEKSVVLKVNGITRELPLRPGV